METTATPGEAVGIGASVGITLYGLAVVILSLLDHEHLVLPDQNWLIAVVMIATGVVGAALGAGFERTRK